MSRECSLSAGQGVVDSDTRGHALGNTRAARFPRPRAKDRACRRHRIRSRVHGALARARACKNAARSAKQKKPGWLVCSVAVAAAAPGVDCNVRSRPFAACRRVPSGAVFLQAKLFAFEMAEVRARRRLRT
ncbi:hypothetical protein MTO96_016681 [Rhipicephalus appendiculatus]